VNLRGEHSNLEISFPKNLLVLDLETTGRDPEVHSTIEIGVVLLDGNTLEEIDSWSTLIKRQEANSTDQAAMLLHGRTPREIESGKDAKEAVEELLSRFGTDYLIAGWNVGFDVQFLRTLLRKTGHHDAFTQIDYHRVDVWSIAQFLKSIGWFHNDVSSLSCLCEELGLPRARAHSGLEDARVTAAALRRLVEMSSREVAY
jgi:DNA polymerase-3 subunit epsilon